MTRNGIASLVALTALSLGVTRSEAGILVTENTANDVRLYTAPGVFTSSPTTTLNGPVGVAIDPSNNVYVVNNADIPGSVSRLTPTLGSPTVFVANGTNSLNAPFGNTFDSAGNQYIANYGIYAGQSGAQQGGIVQLNPAGVAQVTFALGSSRVPAGIAFSPVTGAPGAGYNLYVTENATNTLNVYSTSNLAAAAVVLNPTGVLALNSPTGVAVDPIRGIVYIANSGTANPAGANANTIEAYNIATGTFSIFAAGGGLSTPQGVAVDPAGNVYVSNIGTGTILEYTSAGAQFATPFATGLRTPEFLAYTPVPEPSSMVIMGLGQVGLLGGYFFRRRLHKTA